MNIEDIGWNSAFNFHFEQLEHADLEPARIARQDRLRYQALSTVGEVAAEVSGRLRRQMKRSSDFPAVGDWVALRRKSEVARIEAVLPRKSEFSRRRAGGRTDKQVLAANLDTVFLVVGLDGDYNLRRIERYVHLSRESGATPVVILNKVDLCGNLAATIREVGQVASACEIHALCAKDGTGLTILDRYLTRGSTVALLGSSGVGKSTIVNRLLGSNRQKVSDVREDDSRGRHTTVRRELIVLPGGGALIDTPGLRELRLLGDEETLGATFADIEAFAALCRFADCVHDRAPGCAVRGALEQGKLDVGRYLSYLKLQRELQTAARQRVPHEDRARERRFSKMARAEPPE